MNKKVLQLEVMDEGLLRYGQRVYDLFCTDIKKIAKKCSVCKGTGEVTLEGLDLQCPRCHGSGEDDGVSLTLYNYEPNEYIINEIIIKGPFEKAAYKEDGSLPKEVIPETHYSGFAVTHRAVAYNAASKKIHNVSSRHFYAAQFKSNHIDKGAHPTYHNSQSWFTDISEAREYIRMLHELQKKLLNAFNLKHGTDYEYPFEI